MIKSWGSLRGMFCVIAVLFSAGPAFGGDIGQGKVIAETWCASCHTVSARMSGSDSAPTFYGIANAPDFSAAAARKFMAEPHPPMPRLDLTLQQIDNLVAYLKTFRKLPAKDRK